MTDQNDNDLVAKRKRAYAYIKLIFQGVAWDKDLTIDENLADFLDTPLNDLDELREGRSNPSLKIVHSVKEFFNDSPDQYLVATLERELVDPFS